MKLTKYQKELLNLLKNDSSYYISYDKVMARASLKKESRRIKFIHFNTFLVINNFLQQKEKQPYGTIVYLELNPNINWE